MTSVIVDLRVWDATSSDGVSVPVGGRLVWRPVPRRDAEAFTVLPAAYAVSLTTNPQTITNVTPCTAVDGWCWEVREEHLPGARTRYVLVPAVASVAYSALVDVDPATLTVPAPAAWTLTAQDLQDQIDDLVVGGGGVPPATSTPDGHVLTADGAGAYAWEAPTGGTGGGAPAAHAASHGTGGTDPVTPAAIGAATSGHTHPGVYDPAGTAATVAAAAVTEHAAAGDPHPGYLTQTEADARYSLQGQGGTGVTDHGALTGLADDDHPQYLTNARGDARYDATGEAAAAQAAAVQRANHTGTQSLDTTSDSATRLAMTSAERTKLTGVAAGATANAPDAQLRDRTTHTGTQAVSTVTGLQTALDAKVDTPTANDRFALQRTTAAVVTMAASGRITAGSGTYDDPWRVAVPSATQAAATVTLTSAAGAVDYSSIFWRRISGTPGTGTVASPGTTGSTTGYRPSAGVFAFLTPGTEFAVIEWTLRGVTVAGVVAPDITFWIADGKFAAGDLVNTRIPCGPMPYGIRAWKSSTTPSDAKIAEALRDVFEWIPDPVIARWIALGGRVSIEEGFGTEATSGDNLVIGWSTTTNDAAITSQGASQHEFWHVVDNAWRAADRNQPAYVDSTGSYRTLQSHPLTLTAFNNLVATAPAIYGATSRAEAIAEIGLAIIRMDRGEQVLMDSKLPANYLLDYAAAGSTTTRDAIVLLFKNFAGWPGSWNVPRGQDGRHNGTLQISSLTQDRSVRFRTSGLVTDMEMAGKGMWVSTHSGADFTGQQVRIRFSEDPAAATSLVGEWSFEDSLPTLPVNPTAANEAARKAYVDSAVAGVQSITSVVVNTLAVGATASGSFSAGQLTLNLPATPASDGVMGYRKQGSDGVWPSRPTCVICVSEYAVGFSSNPSDALADDLFIAARTAAAPAITVQPSNATVAQAGSTTLSVTATGTPAPTYQWQSSTTQGGTYANVSGGTGATTAAYSPPTSSVGTLWYRCVVTNTSGSVTSTAVSVQVTAAAPTFTTTIASSVDSGDGSAATPWVSQVAPANFLIDVTATIGGSNAAVTIDSVTLLATDGTAIDVSYAQLVSVSGIRVTVLNGYYALAANRVRIVATAGGQQQTLDRYVTCNGASVTLGSGVNGAGTGALVSNPRRRSANTSATFAYTVLVTINGAGVTPSAVSFVRAGEFGANGASAGSVTTTDSVLSLSGAVLTVTPAAGVSEEVRYYIDVVVNGVTIKGSVQASPTRQWLRIRDNLGGASAATLSLTNFDATPSGAGTSGSPYDVGSGNINFAVASSPSGTLVVTSITATLAGTTSTVSTSGTTTTVSDPVGGSYMTYNTAVSPRPFSLGFDSVDGLAAITINATVDGVAATPLTFYASLSRS